MRWMSMSRKMLMVLNFVENVLLKFMERRLMILPGTRICIRRTVAEDSLKSYMSILQLKILICISLPGVHPVVVTRVHFLAHKDTARWTYSAPRFRPRRLWRLRLQIEYLSRTQYHQCTLLTAHLCIVQRSMGTPKTQEVFLYIHIISLLLKVFH